MIRLQRYKIPLTPAMRKSLYNKGETLIGLLRMFHLALHTMFSNQMAQNYGISKHSTLSQIFRQIGDNLILGHLLAKNNIPPTLQIKPHFPQE